MNAQTDSRPSLAVAALSISIGGRAIVRDCSLEFRRGEFVTLVGPNGAGKSTLLRALAGLSRYSGSIRLEGRELLTVADDLRARTIAYLPQQASVHWPMRVRDVVALGRLPFGASMQKLSAADAEIVGNALQKCAIQNLADFAATELSGGELSRVLLARALAVEAPILLVDEPTASLDPAHQIRVMQALAQEAAAGRLVISVSHDIGLALPYSTRMLAMSDGAVAGDSTPSGLLDSGVLERIFGVRFHMALVGGAQALAISQR